MSKSSSDDEKSVSAVFDKQLQLYQQLKDSTLSSNSKEYQDMVNSLVDQLRLLKKQVDELDLYSANEELQELSTNSMKMILIPALLGFAMPMLISGDRSTYLKTASAHLKEFICLAKSYNLTSSLPEPNQGNMSMEEQRTEKMRRFLQLKTFTQKLEALNGMKNETWDEEQKRDFYLTSIQYFCLESVNESKSIEEEINLLAFRESRKQSTGDNPEPVEKITPKTWGRPVLLTKNDIQKKVYGQGYPSLPVMTVSEFYDQRVKDGVFKPAGPPKQPPKYHNSPQPEEVVEGEETLSLESLRLRDDWRDTHRTGWGNTYNRS